MKLNLIEIKFKNSEDSMADPFVETPADGMSNIPVVMTIR